MSWVQFVPEVVQQVGMVSEFQSDAFCRFLPPVKVNRAKGTVFGKSWICRKWRSAVQVLICPGLTGPTDVLHF